jgi:hypothetical protein
MSRLAVVGSRTFNDKTLLFETLDSLEWEGKPVVPSLIVSGGASGADRLAEVYASTRKIPTKIIRPDWAKHGKAAGPIRNREIVKEADLIIAFWGGKSRGTLSTKQAAEKAGKPFIHIEI